MKSLWLFTLAIAVSFILSLHQPTATAQTSTTPSTRPMVDQLTPAGPGDVHLAGRLGDKLDLCVGRHLLAQNFEKFIAPYRDKREIGPADWRCEYWGKWFTALALADGYQPTAQSATIRDQATHEMLTTAAPDGYLGTREMKYRMRGWDTWGCKYALLGVLADYDRTGDPVILQAARRQGDVLIAQFGEGNANIENFGEWNGLAASSVLEPIVQLYQRTGDAKYLAFADHIVASWEKPSMRLKNGMRLLDDALAGKPPSQFCAPKGVRNDVRL